MGKTEIIIKITDENGIQTTKFNVSNVDIEQFRHVDPIYNDLGQISDFKDAGGITVVITAKLDKLYEN